MHGVVKFLDLSLMQFESAPQFSNATGVEIKRPTLKKRLQQTYNNNLNHDLSIYYLSIFSWGIVIHGGIDGFSRKVMYLHASNNRASTVLRCFLGAIQTHGLPQCVRSDKGGENVDVARYMLEHPERGPGQYFSISVVTISNLKRYATQRFSLSIPNLRL